MASSVREYRFFLPGVTEEEYVRGSAYSMARESLLLAQRGEARVRTLAREAFRDEGAADARYQEGVFSHRRLHLGSRVPAVLRFLAPRGSLSLEEKRWVCGALCKSEYSSEHFGGSCLWLESVALEKDSGAQENALRVPERLLQRRKVERILVGDSGEPGVWVYSLAVARFPEMPKRQGGVLRYGVRDVLVPFYQHLLEWKPIWSIMSAQQVANYERDAYAKLNDALHVYAAVVHGSPDSTDVDVMLLVNRLPTPAEEREQQTLRPAQDLNYAVVRDGRVLDVLHGLPDEVHAQLLRTAREPVELLSKEAPPRVVESRFVVCVMKLLVCTRKIPKHRAALVQALRKSDIASAIKALKRISFPHAGLSVDFCKVVAFQLVQTLALLRGHELYTKQELADFWPAARPVLYREADADLAVLDELRDELLGVPLKLQRNGKRLTVTLEKRSPVTLELGKNRVRVSIG